MQRKDRGREQQEDVFYRGEGFNRGRRCRGDIIPGSVEIGHVLRNSV